MRTNVRTAVRTSSAPSSLSDLNYLKSQSRADTTTARMRAAPTSRTIRGRALNASSQKRIRRARRLPLGRSRDRGTTAGLPAASGCRRRAAAPRRKDRRPDPGDPRRSRGPRAACPPGSGTSSGDAPAAAPRRIRGGAGGDRSGLRKRRPESRPSHRTARRPPPPSNVARREPTGHRPSARSRKRSKHRHADGERRRGHMARDGLETPLRSKCDR